MGLEPQRVGEMRAAIAFMGRLIKLSRWRQGRRLGCHTACKAIPGTPGTRCNRISVMELISRVRGDLHPSNDALLLHCSFLLLAGLVKRIACFNLEFSIPYCVARTSFPSVDSQSPRTSCRSQLPNLKGRTAMKGRCKITVFALMTCLENVVISLSVQMENIFIYLVYLL